jgi:2,2-dialkylglycine decarboxylase (pyruvate)|tara:strand:+ start:1611 stop:3017 length:1407 start_codon:yes stop_codon:yes gene_type:complete
MDKQIEKAFSFSKNHKELMERDSKVISGWRYEPSVFFERGEGVKLFDVDGNEYYDLSSGMMSLPLGHAHPELCETIKSMADRFHHQSSWYSNPWTVELAELIVSTLPGDLNIINFAVTGSEANEIAMRMALGYTGGFDICSVVRGLHGGSLAAEAVTSVGGGRKKGLGPLSIPAKSNCIIAPFYYRAPVKDQDEWDRISLQLTRELMEFTTSQEVAAIIMEPMMVPGGMIVPSKQWVQGIREIADEWEALLIFDEMQLAPSRTGKMWGFEHFGVQPDIVTFGKGISAGFANCGTVTSHEIVDKCKGNQGLPWAGTYNNDPLPAAVALKQLQIIIRDDVTGKAAKVGDFLEQKLVKLQNSHECIGDVRGKGLYRMLDIVVDRNSRTPNPELAERIRREAMKEGIAMIAVKNYMRICPPLIITENEIDDVVGRLDKAITRAVENQTQKMDYSSSSSLASVERIKKVAQPK